MRGGVLAAVVVIALSGAMVAQNDVLGSHNLSLGGGSPTKGGLDACLFCHAPHSGVGQGPLWSQKLSTQQGYALYTKDSSTTMSNTEVQPSIGVHSNLCLSCHDGTVAPGQNIPYGQIQMNGSMRAADVFGTNLQGSHPFSLKLPLVDSPNLVSGLASSGTTADPLHQVKLVGGNVECTSCHNPHSQIVDKVSMNFLVRDSVDGQLCLSCHEINARTVGGKTNPLAQWATSVHAIATNTITSTNLGSYGSVAHNSCLSCHMPHNSIAGARLLRGPVPAPASVDSATQSCMTCHNGGSNISPAIPNVYAEFAKKGHPFPQGANAHDAAESAVLNNNRHATCVDCHESHSANKVTSFNVAPAIRLSQNGAVGVRGDDGTTILNPAVNQYETCLRCHGTSGGKPTSSTLGYIPAWLVSVPGDPFDVRRQFAASAVSSHPVMHARTGNLEPSLLPSIWNLDGATAGRSLGGGTQIFCTDCHNSDDNREFGGVGPAGPHGSQYDHIFERRYEFSRVGVAGPGTAVLNLYPSPSTSPNCSSFPCASPYALCAKCHDLNNVLSDAAGSFQQHKRHVNDDGFSCSVCHTGHGVPQAGTTTGQRLINFDVNVVAPNASGPITYNPGSQSCTLTCHGHQHGS
jgi:predicted CXXCH cytochrome family protein